MSAVFSSCRRYRYVLERRWSDTPALAIIGHNPSKAGQVACPRCGEVFVPYEGFAQSCPVCEHGWDRPGTGEDEVLDPTVRKCMAWARRDGFGGLVMLNLCAAIGTDSDSLTLMTDHVGQETDEYLVHHAREAGRVVAAWGQLAAKSRNQIVRGRPLKVLATLAQFVDLYAFRLSMDGTPWHPLYLPNRTTSFLWRERSAAR